MARRSPRRIGIRGKVLLLSLALIASGLAGATAYVWGALGSAMLERERAELVAEGGVAAAAIEASRAYDSSSADRIVGRLSHESGARVTLIDPTGRVVADSAVSPSRIATLDNHASRPEVRAARASGMGTSSRQSGTLHEPLLYVARRIEGPSGDAWVVRLAVAPRVVDAQRAAVSRLLVVGALLGLLAAALLSSVGVTLLARPLRGLAATARMMVRDFSARATVEGGDEIAELARALNDLAEAVTGSIASVGHERDRLEAILEGMAEGVLVTDAEGVVVVANRALREMFFVGRDVIGKAPIEGFRVAELHDALRDVAQSRAPMTREFTLGGLRPRVLIARLTPIDGDAPSTVAVLRDVTELRRLETIRRDFVANVSHELRTPIAAIAAAVETLQDGAVSDRKTADEFLAIIDRHALRLRQLVADLLELSRIEAHELKLAPESVRVASVVDHVVETFRLAAEKKRVALDASVAANLPEVYVDARALEQIISNLVDNAIKYVPDGRHVRIRAESRDGRVRMTVEDDGPGIEAKHLPRLFERFYRVDAGRSRQVGGTGLGLAIVKHLAEAIGANVSVESEWGHGARFHVDLGTATDASRSSASA